jgi:hypothetical protein
VAGLDLERPLHAVWPKGAKPKGPARELLSLIRSKRASRADQRAG